MSRLDDRERRYALAAAATGAVAAVVIWIPFFNQSSGVLLAVIGVLLSGLLAVAARSRRRLATGLMAVLLAFGPWGGAWVIGFPFLCLAAWLLLRGSREAAEEAARRRAEGDDRQASTKEPSRRRRRQAPVEATVEGPTGPARPARPTANKRYTPPRNRR